MAVRRRGAVPRASAPSPRSARGLGAVVAVALLGTALSPSAGGVARASTVSPGTPALITAGPPALAAGTAAGAEEGDVTVLEGFDGALPASYFPWASRSGLTPALSVVTDGSAPGTGNRVLEAVVAEDTVAGDYLGFTEDTAPEDWSAGDGFRFRYLGTGSGRTLSFEVKNAGRLFDQAVVDDTVGWRTVSVLFADLRLKGDPAADARFDPSAATGFAVTLTGLGAGDHRFDDFGLFTRSTTLTDFEGDVAIGSLATPVGVFPWSSAGATVTAAVSEEDRGGVAGHVLRGSYAIPSGGYGGISDNLPEPADWSGHGAIRFWWYASQSSNPASPTAGADIEVELKDGGPDAEHAERWTTTFKDGWGSSTSRWKLVELPFTAFAPDDYQPGAGDTLDGRLDLTRAWGTGITFAPGAGAGSSTGYAIDDLQLVGRPAVVTDVSVTTDRDVYLVDPGGFAEVSLRVTTRTGEPLPSPVTVSYLPGTTTVGAGAPFSGSGSVTFPAGTASGGTERVVLTALGGTDAGTAASAPLVLESPGVGLPTADARLVVNAHGLPYLDPARPVADRTADLLGRMTLEEKAGQMAQAERLGLTSPAQIAELGLGSLLSGGGSVPDGNTPTAWADMIDGYQRQALSTRLQIPLLYGADAVHGHSNVLGATIFPHNIGLGATRDPALVQEIAEATAAETRASGVAWAFAPCLCVSRDERWGRAYESFGEDPALVESFARANIVGLQGEDPGDMSAPDEVLASAKHWAGDGGTRYEPSQAGVGYPIDQGVTHADSLEDFTSLFVDPYLPALDAGVGTIMPSYSGVDLGDGTVRMHENRLLNTTVLKEQLGFDGFLISDWEGIDKLPGGTYPEKVVRSVNSGLDMAMAPYNSEAFIDSVTDAVGRGDIEAARVDDAVSRILSRKFALGLFDRPFADRSLLADFGGPAHRAIARRAAAESQVLLKNDGVLPLDGTGSFYVAGSNADDLGHQLGGWSIAWQGGSGDTTTGTSILEGIREVAPGAAIVHSQDASAPMDGASTGIVVVGEAPYAEGVGDVGNNGNSLSLSEADRTAIDRVCGAMECVVLVVSGRPQLIADRLEGIDGLVASFLPGSEGAGVADPLFGRTPYTGMLPVTWPRTAEQVPINVGDADYDPLFPYGWGLRTD